MYGKIFEFIYDGTLVENWKALVTFQQMIILCDDDGIVDMTPRSLANRTGIPIEIISEGIESLEKEDPYSRTPDEDGKRIVRIDDHRPWGWRLVNHMKYRQMACYEDKKRADRERIAKKRKESKGVAKCSDLSHEVADVAHTDTDINIYTAFENAGDGYDYLLTRKKRKLSGKRWETFNLFWDAFGYKKGKREAADAWLDIPMLTQGLVKQIVAAAEREAKRRPDLVKDGKTPKMAQGWISASRWEDEDYEAPQPQMEIVNLD